MHVLFVTYDAIFPPDSGGKTRAFNLLKHSNLGGRRSIFSFVRDGYDLSNIDEIKKLGVSSVEFFPRRKRSDFRNIAAIVSKKESIFSSLYFRKNVAQTIKRFVQAEKVDLVHFESFYTGFYISKELRKIGVKQVYGSENIEYRLYAESLGSMNPLIKKVMSREVNKIEQEEASMAGQADAVLAVTKEEKEYFSKFSQKTYLIPNGVDPQCFPLVKMQDREVSRILFVGNFNYFPNVDGLKYFIAKVWPSLDQDKFVLTILGRNAESLNFLPKKNVETLEYVADLYDVLASTDIFVSPLRFGGGTNFKVLEAMAAGVPVVALQEKALSLGAKNDRDIITAENADKFIEGVKMLAEDLELRKKIGENAREFVSANYAWDEIGKKLYGVWREIVYEKN